jgi:hypothetical protein
MECEEPSTMTVTIEADGGGEGPVAWRLCGRHGAAVGAILLGRDSTDPGILGSRHRQPVTTYVASESR